MPTVYATVGIIATNQPPEGGSAVATNSSLVTMIANQMMKGMNYGRLSATKAQKEAFEKRHEKQIRWVLDQLPQCRAGVGAALVNAMIRYGSEEGPKFALALKNMKFSGHKDPAHMLWKFMLRYTGRDVVYVYKKSVYCIKSWMAGKRDVAHMRDAKTDFFEWDEGFTVPDIYLANWNPDYVPDEAVAATG